MTEAMSQFPSHRHARLVSCCTQRSLLVSINFYIVDLDLEEDGSSQDTDD